MWPQGHWRPVLSPQEVGVPSPQSSCHRKHPLRPPPNFLPGAGQDLLLAEGGSLGMVRAYVAPGGACTACAGLNGSSDEGHPGPARPVRSLFLDSPPPLSATTRTPYAIPPAQFTDGREPGTGQGCRWGGGGGGQVMSLIDLLGPSVCHPADVKMGSGRTGGTPLRLLALHCSQDWGPRQSGVRPNGRGSVTNPPGSTGAQCASARPAWSPRRAGVGTGGSGSPLRLFPFNPGCLRPGFKSWVRIKSQSPSC